MNHSIEPVLSLTHFLPPFLSLSLFLFSSLSFPILSSFASRSVLSWNIYSSPGPASPNRHTNSRLNIAQRSPHAFPSVSGPKTQRPAIHTLLRSGHVPVRQPQGSLQDVLRRMAGGRKCPHVPCDPLLLHSLLPSVMQVEEDGKGP